MCRFRCRNEMILSTLTFVLGLESNRGCGIKLFRPEPECYTSKWLSNFSKYINFMLSTEKMLNIPLPKLLAV